MIFILCLLLIAAQTTDAIGWVWGVDGASCDMTCAETGELCDVDELRKINSEAEIASITGSPNGPGVGYCQTYASMDASEWCAFTPCSICRPPMDN